MRGTFGPCEAGSDGLQCGAQAYCYHSACGLYLCVDHWSFWSDVNYDLSTLPSVGLYDHAKETDL